MERLSLELLQHLCGFLGRGDLSHFSLVSKKCWAASRPAIFHTVFIAFSSPETLEASVERCNDVLAPSGSFKYVQHLQVLAKELYSLYNTAEYRGFKDGKDSGDDPLHPWRYCAIKQSLSQPLTDGAQWQKLNELLGKFPALRGVTWGCIEQIPRCILRYLHESLPQCRLHMRNFCLRSLVQPPQSPIRVDPYELELVTSPCLYSIAMRYSNTDDSGYANYNESAILDMAAGLAPNLREISLLRERPGSTPWLVAGLRVRRQTWSGDFLSSTPAKFSPHSAVKCLDLLTSNSFDALKSWSRVTDLSMLRSLKVHYHLDLAALRWLADKCRFSSLDTLVISLALDGEDTMEDLAEATECFLLSLPPLRELKIYGQYQQRTIYAVINHSGQALRKLHLPLCDDRWMSDPEPDYPAFASSDLLHELQQKCPFLEDLALCMLRSQGDACEVAIYRGLGEISTLRKIHLSLYCSQALTWDEDLLNAVDFSDSSTMPGKEDEIAVALVNMTIDETLARSVFHTISAARNTYATRLEHLTLRIGALDLQGGFDFGFYLGELLRYMGRSWICTGSLRDDRLHECMVEEQDPDKKLNREWMEEKGELADLVDVKFAPALQRVWPGISSVNWKNEWHSFPLQA